VIVLYDAGTKQLLGNPIGNFLNDRLNALDTAVTCALDEYLPDPIFMEPITTESNEEECDMEEDD